MLISLIPIQPFCFSRATPQSLDILQRGVELR